MGAFSPGEIKNVAHARIIFFIEEQIGIIRLKLEQYRSVQEQQAIKLMQTIRGIGPVISNALATTISCFENYETDKQVAKYLGLTPVNERSGTSVKRSLGINRTAVPHVRAKLFVAATAAIAHNPRCAELYTRLRANGKPPKVAKVAVMRQLIRWAFAIVKSGKPFDENYQQRNKRA